MTFYSFLFLFFAYSFLGWVGEVLYTAVTRRRYQDRGVLNGPLCILYGIGAHLISFALRDLSHHLGRHHQNRQRRQNLGRPDDGRRGQDPRIR